MLVEENVVVVDKSEIFVNVRNDVIESEQDDVVYDREVHGKAFQSVARLPLLIIERVAVHRGIGDDLHRRAPVHEITRNGEHPEIGIIEHQHDGGCQSDRVGNENGVALARLFIISGASAMPTNDAVPMTRVMTDCIFASCSRYMYAHGRQALIAVASVENHVVMLYIQKYLLRTIFSYRPQTLLSADSYGEPPLFPWCRNTRRTRGNSL